MTRTSTSANAFKTLADEIERELDGKGAARKFTKDDWRMVVRALRSDVSHERKPGYDQQGQAEILRQFATRIEEWDRPITPDSVIPSSLRDIADTLDNPPTVERSGVMALYESCKCPDEPTRCFSDRVLGAMLKLSVPSTQRTSETIAPHRDDTPLTWARMRASELFKPGVRVVEAHFAAELEISMNAALREVADLRASTSAIGKRDG